MSLAPTVSFRPSRFSLEIRLAIWLLVLVLPVFLGRLALNGIIERDEVSRRQQAEIALTNEMERFIADIRLENRVKHLLAGAEQRAGLPASQVSWRYRFFSGSPLPFSPASLERHILEGLQREFSCQPLLLMTCGPDAFNVRVSGDESRLSRFQFPPKKRTQELFLWLAQLWERKAWSFPDLVNESRRSYSSPALQNLLYQKLQRFWTAKFGYYARFNGSPQECFSFFCPFFGRDRILASFRLVFAHSGRDAPLLGGYFIFIPESSLSASRVMAQARRLAFPGFTRSVVRRHIVSGHGFHQTDDTLSTFFPVPNSFLNYGIHHHRHLLKRLLPIRPKRKKTRFVPFLRVSQSSETVRNPWRGHIKALDLVLAACFCLTLHWTFHPEKLLSQSRLRIRHQLLVAVTLAVFFPLAGFWAVAGAFWQFQDRLESKNQLNRMTARLETLEMGLSSFELANRARFWHLRAPVSALLSRGPAAVRAELGNFLKHIIAEGLILVAADGSSFSAISSHTYVPEDPIREGTFWSAFAAGIFREAEQLTPSVMDRLRQVPGGKSGLAVSQNISTDELNDIVTKEGGVIQPKFFPAFDRQYSLVFLRHPATAQTGLAGLLFLRTAYERLLDRYFQSLPAPQAELRETSPGFLTHTAVFQTSTLSHSELVPDKSWPRHSPEIRALYLQVQEILRSGREGAWEYQAGSTRRLVAFHKYSQWPFVAISVAEPLPDGTNFAAFPLVFAGLFSYSALIILIIVTILNRVFLIPISAFLTASERVALEDLQAEIDLPGGDEFSRMGAEFNRMVKGLRERKRLERFLSAETVEAVRRSDATDASDARRVTCAILFSHIRDFSSLAETYSPELIVDLLNAYLPLMESAIRGQGGSIDKYIADAVMATFPDDDGQSPSLHAARAARDMQQRLATLNSDREKRNLFTIAQGIGIATGEVISGNIGSLDDQLSRTCIGDRVNLAARLEAQSHHLVDGGVLLCPTTAAEIGGHLPVKAVGAIVVKGKKESVTVFTLSGETA